jgi:outer membrane protein
LAQTAPASSDRLWHAIEERQIESDAKHFREPRFSLEPNKKYSLAELIDLAEAHTPETRIAWEGARARLAALGVARSELYPTLAAIALSQTNRAEVLSKAQADFSIKIAYSAISIFLSMTSDVIYIDSNY